jgi:hypothetical protein
LNGKRQRSIFEKINGKFDIQIKHQSLQNDFKVSKSLFVSQAIYGHSGTLMNGDPLVCGGYNNVAKADCFYYQKDTKKWQKVTKDLII